MSLCNENAMKTEIEILEQELLYLKGRRREEAVKAYRRLLRLDDKPIYLNRRYE